MNVVAIYFANNPPSKRIPLTDPGFNVPLAVILAIISSLIETSAELFNLIPLAEADLPVTIILLGSVGEPIILPLFQDILSLI